MKRKQGIYEKYIKRLIDIVCSLAALIVLSPVLLILTIVGAIKMKGNPFFTQERPGKDEKIFKLYKFRTMTNERDKEGNLLPDSERVTVFGKFLRSTSLDELPELYNILKGDMSLIGPRPLLVKYLDYYTEEEHQRHSVLPGLTGLAQVNGRNFISWEEIFRYDLMYINDISFIGDLKIILSTIKKVVLRKEIEDVSEVFTGEDGKLHIIVNEKDYIVHKALDVERREKFGC